ncbi:MAG: hypothetical protein D8M58_00055 [Calditrichaeota bacterium]|nr:MAG: hypothetical protein DWQ03_07025 [Calditrichota bacterium]MBL1203761.1 hypothetical protein [Calditrichota bacterium]NOG43591.1 hypothetical protein [Calditrichota bacterium]
MDKKEEEIVFVKELFKKLGIKTEPSNSECPDFIFKHNKVKVGIEVTRIFKNRKIEGRPLHALESERDSIVKIAMQSYTELEKFPALDVAVFFGSYPKLTKAQRYDLAKKLKDLIIQNLPGKDSTVRVNNNFEDLENFPEYFDSIRISNFSFLTKNYWQVPVAGFVQKNFIQELQDIINVKNTKLDSYKEKCEECWLLVVADSNFPSSFFDPDIETKNYKYKCNFEKAFCMWDWYGDYFEIQNQTMHNKSIK